MKKYIVSPDVEIYTTHGPVRANVIYDEFLKNNLSPDFKIAGFHNVKEVTSKINNMTEFSCSVGIMTKLSAIGISNINMIIYPNQKVLDYFGNSMNLDTANSGDLLLSLNGALEVEYVGEIDESNEYIYYIIEADDNMTSLYVNNLIILPIEEGENNKHFFEKSMKE